MVWSIVHRRRRMLSVSLTRAQRVLLTVMLQYLGVRSVSALAAHAGHGGSADAQQGKISRGTKRLFVSELAHANVLPQYRWMCKMSGAEFAESGYCKVSNSSGSNYNTAHPINPPCKVADDPSCPDSVFPGAYYDCTTNSLLKSNSTCVHGHCTGTANWTSGRWSRTSM